MGDDQEKENITYSTQLLVEYLDEWTSTIEMKKVKVGVLNSIGNEEKKNGLASFPTRWIKYHTLSYFSRNIVFRNPHHTISVCKNSFISCLKHHARWAL